MPAPWDNAPDPGAWKIRNLTPWLPTPAEQDELWLEIYGAEMRRQQELTEKRQAVGRNVRSLTPRDQPDRRQRYDQQPRCNGCPVESKGASA